MSGSRIGSLLVIAACVGAPVQAQTVDSTAGAVAAARTATLVPSISRGELVRVWAPRARLDGALANFARVDSNLVITGQPASPDAAPREWAVPVDAVQRLEVRRGKPRSMTRLVTGVVIGAVAGAAIGSQLVPFIECGGACDAEGKLRPKASRNLGLAIGAPIGGLLGGVIGGMSRARWEPVTLAIR